MPVVSLSIYPEALASQGRNYVICPAHSLTHLSSMSYFKSLESLGEADSRNLHYVITHIKTGQTRHLTVEDFHRAVSAIVLDDSVPDDIRQQFDTARNLAVYAWFCSDFHQVSELKAFSTVEYALRNVLQRKRLGLQRLLMEAVDAGLLYDKGFQHLRPRPKDDSTEYCRSLCHIMPKMRNALAHGSTLHHPGAVMNLQICRDLIIQLYTNNATSK